LKRSLNVKRVSIVLEGMGINHAHVKLYPLHGLESTFKEMWGNKTISFEKYEGYISTLLGPQANMAELKKLAQHISRAF
jgi:radical SAM superfamily enzyme